QVGDLFGRADRGQVAARGGDLAIELADRVVVLDDGKIVADIRVALPPDGIARRERTAALQHELLGLLGVAVDAATSPYARSERIPA
ncbi:MAG: hypothetical protein ABIY39_11645, partial [Sphingomonas sp.]